MKTLALHPISRAHSLIKPGLLITAAILALTAGTAANAGNRHNGHNYAPSISLGITYSPGGHRYTQPYWQPRHYVSYGHYYPVSYGYYRPLRRHGYRRYQEHYNRYDDD